MKIVRRRRLMIVAFSVVNDAHLSGIGFVAASRLGADLAGRDNGSRCSSTPGVTKAAQPHVHFRRSGGHAPPVSCSWSSGQEKECNVHNSLFQHHFSFSAVWNIERIITIAPYTVRAPVQIPSVRLDRGSQQLDGL